MVDGFQGMCPSQFLLPCMCLLLHPLEVDSVSLALIGLAFGLALTGYHGENSLRLKAQALRGLAAFPPLSPEPAIVM